MSIDGEEYFRCVGGPLDNSLVSNTGENGFRQPSGFYFLRYCQPIKAWLYRWDPFRDTP